MSTTNHIVDAPSVHVAVVAGEEVVVNHPAIHGCARVCPKVRLIVRHSVLGDELTPLVYRVLGYYPMRGYFCVWERFSKGRGEREGPSVKYFILHRWFKFWVGGYGVMVAVTE